MTCIHTYTLHISDNFWLCIVLLLVIDYTLCHIVKIVVRVDQKCIDFWLYASSLHSKPSEMYLVFIFFRTLQKLATFRSGCSQHLIDVLFGQTDLGPAYSVARDGDTAQGLLEFPMVFIGLVKLTTVFTKLCIFLYAHQYLGKNKEMTHHPYKGK